MIRNYEMVAVIPSRVRQREANSSAVTVQTTVTTQTYKLKVRFLVRKLYTLAMAPWWVFSVFTAVAKHDLTVVIVSHGQTLSALRERVWYMAIEQLVTPHCGVRTNHSTVFSHMLPEIRD